MEEVDQRLIELESISLSQQDRSLIETESSPGFEFTCDTCGLGFGTEEGRDMHIKHHHPEVHLGSGVPFNRQTHALNGLPQCRFCRQQLFDFASLRKHIACGTCQTLKQAAAKKTPLNTLWQQILDRESYIEPILVYLGGLGRV